MKTVLYSAVSAPLETPTFTEVPIGAFASATAVTEPATTSILEILRGKKNSGKEVGATENSASSTGSSAGKQVLIVSSVVVFLFFVFVFAVLLYYRRRYR